MGKTHLRKPDFSGTFCGKGTRTTGEKASVDCKQCRKAAGLGAFNNLEALRGIVKINESEK